jgi:CheY-like chemotaxis protein
MHLVLVIDKKNRTVDKLEYFLRGHRYRVVSTTDYKKGIVYSRSGSPDIILLGIYPDSKESLQTVVALKRDPVSRDIPVLALFSTDDQSFIKKINRIGITDQIEYPSFDQEHVLSKVQEILLQEEKHREEKVLSRNTHILVEQPSKGLTVISFKSGLRKYVLPEIRTVFNAEFLNTIIEDDIVLDLRDIQDIAPDELIIIETLITMFKKKIGIIAGKHLGVILSQTDIESRTSLFMSMDEYTTYRNSLHKK